MTGVVVRIVVLHTESDVWCEPCGAACAVTIAYVLEEAHTTPTAVRQLTWCETCERHQLH